MSDAADSPDLFHSNESLTGNSPKPVVLDFNYLVLFELDPEVREPFQLFIRNNAAGEEIPINWLTKSMTEKARLAERKIDCLGGKVFCIYAKMERGNLSFILCSQYQILSIYIIYIYLIVIRNGNGSSGRNYPYFQ